MPSRAGDVGSTWTDGLLMRINKINHSNFIRVCLAFVLATPLGVAVADGFTEDLPIKTFLHEKFEGSNAAMVIGLVDEHGKRVFGAGKLDNGTTNEAGGNTVFFIG